MSNVPGPPDEPAGPRDGRAQTLAGSITLDSVREEDLPTLCQWMNNIDDLHLWTTRRRPIIYEDLESDIRRRCRTGLFTVIRDTKTREVLGFLDGTLRERHGIAEFEVYVPDTRRLRRGLWGIYRFVSHLFASYPLRKVYCQTYAYNHNVVRLLEASGFVKEGSFKDFTWWRDRYWDMFAYSLERETLEAIQRGEGRIGRLRKLMTDSGRFSDYTMDRG